MSFISRMLKKHADPIETAPSSAPRGPASRIDLLRRYKTSTSAGLLENKPVLLVTDDMRRFKDLIGWIRAQGSDVIRIDLQEMEALSRTNPSKWGLVVVDADSTDLPPLLDTLADMREARRDLPVLLASHYFGRDDLSLSRLTVCDASLKMPMQMARLEFAVVVALENNLVWQTRQI